MSMLGAKLVSHAIQYKSVKEIFALGIEIEYLMGSSKDAFLHVVSCSKTGRYPSNTEIEGMFGIELKEVDEDDLQFIVMMLKKRFVTNRVSPKIRKAVRLLEEREPLEALEVLSGAMEDRKILVDIEDYVHSFKSDGLARAEMYEKVKKMEGIDGLKSMWPSLNKSAGGWCNGLFYSIVGLTAVGKTWALAVIANDMSKRIKKTECILGISTEMNSVRLARRIDCVKFKLKFIGVRDGDLDEESEEFWFSELEKALGDDVDYGDIKLVSRKEVKTVQDVNRLVERFEPKAVLIDGGYRLHGDKGGDWGGQVQIIEDLQDSAEEYPIPWIVTTQLGDAKETGKSREVRKQNAWNVRYAKEWLINPDVVMSLHQNEDLILMGQMEWIMQKIREGDGPKVTFRTHWDKSLMLYDEIIMDKGDDEEVKYE